VPGSGSNNESVSVVIAGIPLAVCPEL
jgi:hypothetical protein